MRPQRTRLRHVTESPPTLSALGLSKRESAERKMGQMLIEGKAAGEVAKQGRPKNLTAGKVIPTKCDDVGISWRESAERRCWQSCLRLPAHVL